MGFLDAVESIISNICSTVEEHNNRVQNYMMRYEHLDDRRLFEQMKRTSSSYEKFAFWPVVQCQTTCERAT